MGLLNFRRKKSDSPIANSLQDPFQNNTSDQSLPAMGGTSDDAFDAPPLPNAAQKEKKPVEITPDSLDPLPDQMPVQDVVPAPAAGPDIPAMDSLEDASDPFSNPQEVAPAHDFTQEVPAHSPSVPEDTTDPFAQEPAPEVASQEVPAAPTQEVPPLDSVQETSSFNPVPSPEPVMPDVSTDDIVFPQPSVEEVVAPTPQEPTPVLEVANDEISLPEETPAIEPSIQSPDPFAQEPVVEVPVPEEAPAPEFALQEPAQERVEEKPSIQEEVVPESLVEEEPVAQDDTVLPVEDNVVIKSSGRTDIYVEKKKYQGVLLSVSDVQEDIRDSLNHLSRVIDDELIISKHVDEWHDLLNGIQENLIAIDMRLFEKGD